MNALVIYHSHYGATRRYAEWIANALSATVCEEKYLRPEMLSSADIVIFGSGIYAGGVSSTALIKKYRQELASKTLVLFTVGLSDITKEESVHTIDESLKRALGYLLSRVHVFYFRGAMDVSRLKFLHKVGMRMLKSMLQKKKERTEDDEELLARFDEPMDFTNQDAIAPLIAFCREQAKI